MVAVVADLLQLVESELDSMSRSERKVADVLLAEPSEITRLSIATFAEQADVSAPTINRFCRKFGAEGFPDFKLKLAQCLAGGMRYVSQLVAPTDTAATYSEKILDSTIASLAEVREKLSPQSIEQVVDVLVEAEQVLFMGLGASSAVALDAERRFFRFGLPVTSQSDVLMQRMLAASASPKQVFFVISYTGRTKVMLESASLARSSGATVIGLTTPGSPLAQMCNMVLGVSLSEDTDIYAPMLSRITHMAILDVLSTGVALRLGPDLQQRLSKIKHSLWATRYDPDASSIPSDDEQGA